MKDELLQIKQDIIDISNDLKTNLADKGITADGTLSQLVNSVSDIITPEPDIWNTLGYQEIPEPLKSGLEYAKEIQKNWNSYDPANSFGGDKKLYVLPSVSIDSIYATNMFIASNLMILAPLQFNVDNVSLDSSFSKCSNLVIVPEMDYTKCSNLSNTFKDCINLQYLGIIDCSNVTRLSCTFQNCQKLKYVPVINTGNVITMERAFQNCLNLEDPDFSNVDTSNVTNMQYMFACESWTSSKITKLDISNFDTSKTTNMNHMFNYLQNLQTLVLPADFASAATNMSYMFQQCPKLETLGVINSVAATNMSYMFDTTSKLRRIEALSVKSMTKMGYTDVFGFSDCPQLRYFVCKDIGTQSSVTSVQFTYYKLTNWGVVNEEQPDAKQSVIDSLITYSYDRASAGFSTCKITLSDNTKALLTEDEIAQITAKGYTLV